MESKFIPTLQAGNGYTYLKLKGILDEDNLLANLLSQIQGRLLLIDMAEIERINSCGVRDWVNWLNQIQALGIVVILLRCSPSVVSQANMVTNFASDAFIHSFYAPYVHPDTGDEQSVLLFTEDLRQNQPIKAPKIFNEDGEELEFDEFEESYFAFINDPRIMNYRIPDDIQAVIQYFLPEAAVRQPVISHRQQQIKSPAAAAPQPLQQNAYGPSYNSYGSGSRAAQNPYASAMNNPAQNPYASAMSNPAQNPYASAMNNRAQNPYASAMNNRAQNPYGGQPQAAAPHQQQANYSNPRQSVPAAVPQPAQQMMRHSQPPIPSSSGYQQIPYAKSEDQQPAAAAAQSMQQDNYNAQPKPAPQPISPLAAQSMARQAPDPVENITSQPIAAAQPHRISADNNMQAKFNMMPNRQKQRRNIIIGITIVAILLLVLIGVLIAKNFM